MAHLCAERLCQSLPSLGPTGRMGHPDSRGTAVPAHRTVLDLALYAPHLADRCPFVRKESSKSGAFLSSVILVNYCTRGGMGIPEFVAKLDRSGGAWGAASGAGVEAKAAIWGPALHFCVYTDPGRQWSTEL